MKILVVMVLLLFIIVPCLYANPHLVCDPQEGVETYELDIDGNISIVQPDPNDVYGFMYDLQGISNGVHSGKARAGNLWGWSDWCPPFGFIVERCSPPSNFRIE